MLQIRHSETECQNSNVKTDGFREYEGFGL